MDNELKNLRKNVRSIVMETLIKHPKTRSNDNELIYRVLLKMGLPTDYSKLREDATNIVSTITRSRRYVQSKNPLLRATDQVSKRRAKLEESYRREMRGM